MATPTLLILPDELLAHVVNLASERGPRSTLALSRTCRRLGSIAQTQLFSDITLDHPVNLCSLVNALHERPDLRQKLVRLHVHYVKTDDDDGYRYDYDYSDSDSDSYDEMRPDASMVLYELGLTRIFSSPLPALTHLSLRSFPRTLLLPSVRRAGADDILPSLDTLVLSESGRRTTGEEGSGVEPWKLLSAFPSVQHVEFRMGNLRFPTRRDTPIHLPRLRTLSINAAVSKIAPDTVPLADFLPSLVSFTMSDIWELESCVHAISTVTPSLKCLVVPVTSAPPAFENYLARLSSLEELRLTGPLDLLAAFPALRQTRIHTLTVEHHASEISDDLLYDLVTQLPHLDRLELNHMGYFGDRLPLGTALEEEIQRQVTLMSNQDSDPYSQLYPTLGSRWTDGASSEGYALALKAAAERGIRVTGTFLRCIGWNDAFKKAFERQLVAHAVKTNAFSLLVDRYGRQGAIDALQRHSPVLFDLISGAGRDTAVGGDERQESNRSAE